MEVIFRRSLSLVVLFLVVAHHPLLAAQEIVYSAGSNNTAAITGSAELVINYSASDTPATQTGAISGTDADTLTITSASDGVLNLRGNNTGFAGAVVLESGTLDVASRANLFGSLSNFAFQSAATGTLAGLRSSATMTVDGGGGATQRIVIAAGRGGRIEATGGTLTFSNYNAGTAAGAVMNLAQGGRLDLVNSVNFTNNATRGAGGAIYGYVGTINVDGGTYRNNSSQYDGGAINNNGGALSIANALFDGNAATWGSGGAVSSGNISSFLGTANIDNTIFRNNTALNDGGALFNNGTNLTTIAQLTGSGLTFENNRSDSNGGAVRNDFGQMTLTNSTFTGNYAYQVGGAISNNHKLGITGGTFSGNSSRSHGGAIHSYYNSSSNNVEVAVTESEFDGNFTTGSGRGGAIYIQEGTLRLTDVAFTNNRSGWNGGAVFQWNGTTNLVVNSGATTASVYSGNRDSNGLGSFYFQADSGKTAAFNANVAAGAVLDMRDRMAGASGGFGRDGTIAIRKTGTGTWNLGGENRFTSGTAGSATTFRVDAGTLYLYRAGEQQDVMAGSINLGGDASAFILGDGTARVTLGVGGDNAIYVSDTRFRNNTLIRGGVGSSGSSRLTVSAATLEGTVSFDNGDSPILVLWGTYRGDSASTFATVGTGEVLVTSTGNQVGTLDIRSGTLGLVVGAESNFSADSVNFNTGTRLNVTGFNGSTLGETTTLITSATEITDPIQFSLGGEVGSTPDYLNGNVQLSPDRRSVIATVGLNWYNQATTPTGAFSEADGRFTVLGDAFEVGTVLADRGGRFVNGWDGKSLDKRGFGVLALLGENTYSGQTIIRGGTLATNNLSGTGRNEADTVVDIRGQGTLSLDIADAYSGEYRKTLIGTGAVVKEGDGRVVLTADNNRYSGVITANGGVLAANRPESLGIGTVITNAEVELAFNGTFSNRVTGAGVLSSRGDITLTGDHQNHTGMTRIDSGTLTLGGTNFLSRAEYRVEDGATLAGEGTVGSLLLRSGGTLAPGSSSRRLATTGAATFEAGSTFHVALNPLNGDATLLTAGDTVSISDGARLAVGVENAARAGSALHRYQIIAATSGFADTTLFDTGPALRLGYSLIQELDPDGLYLTMQTTTPEFSNGLGGLGSPNANRVAAGLDQLVASGQSGSLGTLYDALFNLSADPATVADAFAQLHGEVFASGQHAAMAAHDNFLSQSRYARERVAGALAACLPGQAEHSGRYNLWAGVTGARGNRSDIARYSGYDLRGRGFALGMDRIIRDNCFAGLALGNDRTKQDFDSIRSRADVDAYRAMAYGGYRSDVWVADIYAGYALNRHKTRRSIAFGEINNDFAATARSRYHSHLFSTGVDVGRVFAVCPFTFTPSVGAHLSHSRSPAIRESGGGPANLKVARSDLTAVDIPIGIRMGREMSVGETRIRPEIRAFYTAHLSGNRADVRTRFQAAPDTSFKAKSGDIGAHSGQFGLGLEASLGRQARVRLDYDFVLRRDMTANQLSFGMAFDW